MAARPPELSLAREFDLEAEADRRRDGDGDGVGRDGDGRGDDGPSPPPPPRDDLDEGDCYYDYDDDFDDGSDDDENSHAEDRVGRRSRDWSGAADPANDDGGPSRAPDADCNCEGADDESGRRAAAADDDGNGRDDDRGGPRGGGGRESPSPLGTFDGDGTLGTLDGTLGSCGDDTLRMLRETERRLSSRPPPPVAKRGERNSPTTTTAAMPTTQRGLPRVEENQFDPTNVHRFDFGDLRIREERGENEAGKGEGEEEELSAGLSTAGASLLRGPVMAAESARRALLEEAPSPWARGDYFPTSAREAPGASGGRSRGDGSPRGDSRGGGAATTPSRARSEFPDSARGRPPPRLPAEPSPRDASPGDNGATETPSHVRNEFLASARKPYGGPPLRHSQGSATTPSQARDEFLDSARGRSPLQPLAELSPRNASVGGDSMETPSHVRNEFLASARKPHGRPPPQQLAASNGASPRGLSQGEGGPETPSHARSEFLSSVPKPPRPPLRPTSEPGRASPGASPHGTSWDLSQVARRGAPHGASPPGVHLSAVSPSTARNRFLTSPQDSVSTLGERSPSEGPNHSSAPSAGSGEAASAIQGETGLVGIGNGNDDDHRIPSSVESLIALGERQMRAAVVEVEAAMAPGAGGSAAGGGNTRASSVESVIARGEEQMRTAVAATAGRREGGPTPKRRFLRKGARREPSALRRTDRPSPVAPSAANAREGGNGDSGNGEGDIDNVINGSDDGSQRIDDNNAATASAAETETLSERKARMARLEQMQEDLAKDLERRRARAEEARRGRRKAAAAAKTTASVPAKKTPTTRRSSPPVGAAAGGTRRPPSVPRRRADDGLTPSQARARSATPSQGATPSRARMRPAAKPRAADDVGVVALTPSQVRERVAAGGGLADEGGAEATDATRFAEEISEEDVAPSRARTSSAGIPSPSVDLDDAELQRDGGSAAIVGDKGTGEASKGLRSKSARRHRPASTPRPRGRAVTKDRQGRDEAGREEALHKRKKEEEEQRALIKNMRRRQEAALREAEGERERAKAWAAAERESVRKWAEEQRALIKKDRHRAANAALLASKKAAREKQNGVDDDGEADDREAATRAEVEELRRAMQKAKAEANAEARRMRERIRAQEKTIRELRCREGEKGGNGGSGGTAETSQVTAENKGPPADVDGRRALGDCSSKQNARRNGPKSKAARRKSTESTDVLDRKQGTMAPEPVTLGREEEEEIENTAGGGARADDEDDLWLKRHLSELNDANNRLGEKMEDEGRGREPHGAGEGRDAEREKPYNAADYGGTDDDILMARSPSAPKPPDSVPQVVTAGPPTPTSVRGGRLGDCGASPGDNPPQTQRQSQMFTYKNGTQKEVLPDGTTTVSFANGDRKRTYANEKEGIVVYYYAATRTTQVTHQDGTQTYHFPNQQIENHYPDGRKEVNFPDGTRRTVHANGIVDTVHADGARVVDYPDGTQRVMQA
ncbi:hypothetical protein ACHAWF_015778 [Thalassiosira exigua]